MSAKTVLTEGWLFPPASRKCHYFRGGRSLCGKYGLIGHGLDGPLAADAGPTADDCAPCRRALDKQPPVCGQTRDLYPLIPGKVLLVCNRRPHKSGAHSRRNEQGRVTEQWWGDR